MLISKGRGIILKVVRLLSFDGGNIFKSKQWPYYAYTFLLDTAPEFY